MIRRLCHLLILPLILMAPLSLAAGEQPRVEVTFEQTEAIPGQPLSLHVTVLVPTWMPRPVAFPDLDGPNLIVRLPERATVPISRRIGAQTWSGVTRHYRLIPMVPGRYTIPDQTLRVTWADSETRRPREQILSMPGVRFHSRLPAGAERLHPFVAAEALTLHQEISGAEPPLKPGDSVTRTVTATITGSLPLFLPPLLPPESIPGVARYPAEPVLTESAARGALSGSRTERVTYVAQSGGSGRAEPVAIDWFNLATGKIETARLDGFDLRVDAPPASAPADPRQVALITAAVGLALLLLLPLVRFLWPRLRAAWQAGLARYRASERWAWRRLHRAIRARDLLGTLNALDVWSSRLPGLEPLAQPALCQALVAIGAARYGSANTDETQAWRALRGVLHRLRREARAGLRRRPALPPLNPPLANGSGA